MQLTSEHRQAVNIVKLAMTRAAECSPQVRYEDLRALQQAHPFPIEARFVAKAGKMLGQKIDEFAG